jgi:hypothetical protein
MTLSRIGLTFTLTGAIAMVGLVAAYDAYAEETGDETDSQSATADEELDEDEDQALSPIDDIRKCTEFWPRGRLCTFKRPGGYIADFYTYDIGMSSADFNLEYHSGLIGSGEGPFEIFPLSHHSYFFAVGDLGCGRTVLFDRTGAQPPLYAVPDCE